MRTPTGSASRACHRRVVALIAGVWTFETFIANSTKGSKLRNWHRPERCQFLATEVSRDFIPPCPVQISPAQAAVLGPAIKPVRNPSHQLDDYSRSKGHARPGDQSDRLLFFQAIPGIRL